MKPPILISLMIMLLSAQGCTNNDSKLEHDIGVALKADEVFFQPSGTPGKILLSASQAEVIKRIMGKFLSGDFKKIANVEGYQYGDFLVGTISFRWQGKCFYRKVSSGDYVYAEDLALDQLTTVYFKRIGTPPFPLLTLDDWKLIVNKGLK